MLELGIYPLADVARFTELPPATVRSWFKPRPDGKGCGPVFDSDFDAVDGDYAVSFLNLIDTYIASFFRLHNVKPEVIRKAHRLMQKRFDTAHPFAHSDVRTADGRIIELTPDDPFEAQLVDVLNGQQWLDKAEGLKAEIGYDPLTKLARSWTIKPGIVLRPSVNFGQPVTADKGCSTLIVASQYLANGRDEDFVASLFRTTAKQVIAAYQFEIGIGRIAA
jgi:uncharacterized protein (DUF433 family)